MKLITSRRITCFCWKTWRFLWYQIALNVMITRYVNPLSYIWTFFQLANISNIKTLRLEFVRLSNLILINRQSKPYSSGEWVVQEQMLLTFTGLQIKWTWFHKVYHVAMRSLQEKANDYITSIRKLLYEKGFEDSISTYNLLHMHHWNILLLFSEKLLE